MAAAPRRGRQGEPEIFRIRWRAGALPAVLSERLPLEGYTDAERDYKVAAKQRLDETAPLEQAVNASGLGAAVLAVFRARNLLSPFEKGRLQDVLRGPLAD